MSQSYRDLVVWNKAMELVMEIYRLTQTFPKEENFGLMSQLRRAAASIPSNIAEGQGRLSKGEFRVFWETPEVHSRSWKLISLLPAGSIILRHQMPPAY